MSAFLLAQVVAVAVHGGSTAVAAQGGVTLDGKAVAVSVPQIAGVAFSRDGRLAVFGGRPGERGEVDFGGWKASDAADVVNAVAFGPDWLAAASQDRTIVLYSLDGKRLRTMRGHASAVVTVAASPDGRTLVSGGADATLRVWDPASGELKRTIANHGDRVNALAWSPDGRFLASASRDRTVRIWQPEIGRLVRIVKHDAEVLDVAWPDDVVTASADGMIRIVDAGSDATRRTIEAGGRVSSVASTALEVKAAAGGVLRAFSR